MPIKVRMPKIMGRFKVTGATETDTDRLLEDFMPAELDFPGSGDFTIDIRNRPGLELALGYIADPSLLSPGCTVELISTKEVAAPKVDGQALSLLIIDLARVQGDVYKAMVGGQTLAIAAAWIAYDRKRKEFERLTKPKRMSYAEKKAIIDVVTTKKRPKKRTA
jgi:hypothetical protein